LFCFFKLVHQARNLPDKGKNGGMSNSLSAKKK
jgi:hypothetical protein